MRLTRRAFVASAAVAVAQSQRPNILWIIAEDFSPDLGCYGNKLVHSPNLDALASRGMRFTQAFVTAPVCSASRSAIAAGMYQTTIGGHNHRSHRDDGYKLPGGMQVFTHYLREAGYHTSNIRNARGLRGTGKTDLNYDGGVLFDGDEWSQRRAGQPFYSQINFQEAHRRFHRHPTRPVDPARVQLPACYPDHPAIRLDWATYLDSAQYLDEKAGRVLKLLEQDGAAEDTIVFFFGDHGQPMPRGKQFLYDAGIRIPLILYVPEKYRVAGYKPGTVNEGMVSSIDITATTLQLAGVPVPKHMQGQPFLGEGARTREQIYAARDRCDETVDRIRCVRDKSYKYIRNYYPERAYTQQNVYKDNSYPPLRVMRDLKAQGKLAGPTVSFMADRRPAEELYDLRADRDEVVNVASDPKHAAALDRMRGLLNKWVVETKDQGAVAEKDIPSWDKGRHSLDGWLTQDAKLTKSDGILKVDFAGTGVFGLSRSVVAPGGRLSLEVKARSREVVLDTLAWGTIEDMANPEFRAKTPFVADGEWRTYSVSFEVKGWLGLLQFPVAKKAGTLEIDSIRLSRDESGAKKLVEVWDFDVHSEC